MNAFGYPSLAEEQVKLQKELARQQNIRQLTEALKKAMSEIEHLEKEAADCSKELSEREVALKTVQRLYENARMAVGKDVKALRRRWRKGKPVRFVVVLRIRIIGNRKWWILFSGIWSRSIMRQQRFISR